MDEFDTIKQKMEARRDSLAEKLEALETQVSESVQGMTSAVSNVTEVVQDTVESVKDSVENVKDSLQDTVGAMKETFDLPLQVEKHPWIMMGGALAAGFVAGRLLPSMSASAPSPPQERTFRDIPRWEGEGATRETARASKNGQRKASWFDGLTGLVTPELEKLKNLAMATGLSLVRDYIKQSVPTEVGNEIAGMIDSVTNKLGAEPLHENLLASRNGGRAATLN